MIIPTHVHIETINGICNARCTMCTINLSKRKPNILSIKELEIILNKFKLYQENIEYISLVGYGETLLDKEIISKVKLIRDMGFRGIGIPTNCSNLDREISTNLIKAGLNTIICSIDGFTKETHESIRVGTKFENIVYNVKRLIEIRNNLNKINNKYKTKILIRFIYQDINKHEWSDFYNYWSSILNKNFGDDVIKFNVHSCGDKLEDYGSINKDSEILIPNNYICEDIYNRFIILSNGNVMFCCVGNDEIQLGNVLFDNPIEIYNNELFTHYRKFMNEGRIKELEHCKDCTAAQSRIRSLKDNKESEV